MSSIVVDELYAKLSGTAAYQCQRGKAVTYDAAASPGSPRSPADRSLDAILNGLAEGGGRPLQSASDRLSTRVVQQEVVMRSGHCVKCQRTEVFQVPLRRYADTGVPLTSMRRADVTVLICTACGYLETYVDDDSLEAVRKHGRRVGFVPDVPQPPAKPFWEA